MAEGVREDGAQVGGMADAAEVVGLWGRCEEKHEISSTRATAS